MARSTLLLAYDGECSLCVKRVDWIRDRDRQGLLVLFPLQHPELAHMAPELAGRRLHGELHGVDLGSRKVLTGAALLPEILVRLGMPWPMISPLLRLPWIGRAAAWIALKREERRFQKQFR